MKKIITVILIAGMGVYFNSCKKTVDKVTPTACFTYSPTEIHVGDEVSFSSDCSANAASYSWDFGDGVTSTDVAPTHTYNTAGDFTVKLDVKDAAGLTNSSSQTITVSAAVIPPGNMHEGDITADETWAAGIHEVTGEVYVDGATLTIEPGAIIKFDQNTGLFIGYNGGTAGATLIANGTADKPIVFTSSADNKSAGDWEYIGFYSGASGNCSMKYCTVEYAGGYSDYGGVYLESSSITFENSFVQNSANGGITCADNAGFNSFTYDTLRDNAGDAMQIYGNYAHTIGMNNGFMTSTGVRVMGDTYDRAAETWNKLNCPYIIDGEMYIENTTGAKLTLAPGVRIGFTQNSGLFVGYDSNSFGTLIAEGTADDSIYFTSSAPAGSQSPGDWEYLGFYGGAGNNSSLKYCSVQYGGGYSDHGDIYIENSSVKIDNSKIGNSLTSGINTNEKGRFASFTNNVFENNATYPVIIYATYAHTIGSGNTYSDPGILVEGSTVSSTVTWMKQSAPYIIDGAVYVESISGNTLTIDAGTVVKFTNGSEIDVGYTNPGTLVAQGAAGDSIMFTSASPAGNESPGDWNGIFFFNGAGSGSILDMCHVAYGGGYANEGDIITDGTAAGRPTITNCNITDSQAFGIYITSGASPTMSGNTFANNASGNTN